MFNAEGVGTYANIGQVLGLRPYCRHKMSQNSPLLKANPCSLMGNTDSQLDPPFSCAKANDLCSKGFRFFKTSSHLSMISAFLFNFCVTCFFVFPRSALDSEEVSLHVFFDK